MRHSAEKATTRIEKGKREKISLLFLLLISFSLLIFYTQHNLKCKQFIRAHVLFSKIKAKYPHKKKILPSILWSVCFAKKKRKQNKNKNMFSLPTTLFVDAIFVT